MFTPLSGSVSSDSSRGERHSWQWGGEGEMKATLLGPVVIRSFALTSSGQDAGPGLHH